MASRDDDLVSRFMTWDGKLGYIRQSKIASLARRSFFAIEKPIDLLMKYYEQKVLGIRIHQCKKQSNCELSNISLKYFEYDILRNQLM